MSTASPVIPPTAATPWRAALVRDVDWLGALAAVVLLGLVVCALFGAAIAPQDPLAQDISARLLPPVWNAGGSWAHALGTDQLGRDVLSYLIAAARIPLALGFAAAAVEAVIGVSLGLIAGFRGGRAENVIMRLVDVQMGFPAILLWMTIILMVGGSFTVFVAAFALNGWMIFARTTRASVKTLTTQGFVEAAAAAGCRPLTIVRRHIIPHLRVQILALVFLEVARIVLAESVLSFIGIGIQPPDISWGLMLGSSRSYIPVAYHIGLFPGLMIAITAISLNNVATWGEQLLDPLRRRV